MVKCAKCGRIVEKICSSCWRCENCGDEFCREHMKKTMNGIIGGFNQKPDVVVKSEVEKELKKSKKKSNK